MVSNRIKALIQFVGHDVEARRTRALADLAALWKTVDILIAAAVTDDDWQAIFHATCGGDLAREASRIAAQLGIVEPASGEPDGSWMEDALAWVEAFRAMAAPVLAAAKPDTRGSMRTSLALDLAGAVRFSREERLDTAADRIEIAAAAVAMMDPGLPVRDAGRRP